MTAQDPPVEEEVQLDYGDEAEDDWFEEPDELPRRPRRKLLSPVPVALFVVLLVAVAFFAGVQVEKGQGSSSASGGLASSFAALRSARGASSGGAPGSSGAAAGFPGGGGASFGSGALTTGEVSYIDGNTLYVVSGESTVKVSVPAGAKVSKTVSTNVHSIHPGETVVVRGSKGTDGNVKASSITIGSGGLTGLFGGGAGASSRGGAGSGGSSGGSTQQLFGSG